MVTAVCPECGYTVNLGAQPYEGQRVICAGCGANLEVISLGHLELDWVYDTPHHNPEEDRECKEIWEKEIVGGVIAGE